ncbi:MAG: hypothetical protein CVU03_11065 [Bacteroidetes bacterium HGW-Bacteroidetes-2]|jgi:amino acid permease|nr:MAG: hypothetical protein CVU03_11065 [Bacteroidetes bacterium HGW-Bacteroidetes-2]
MFSESKDNTTNEDREQFLYAQDRIRQKKRLNQHFVVFLVGSVFIIVLNQFLGVGSEFFIKNWFVWAILIWAFLFIVHAFNVYVTNSFMGKEWENKQLTKLREKQRKRMIELENKVEHERKTSSKPLTEKDYDNSTPPELE